MKKAELPSVALNAVFAAALSIGSVMCLVTAYSFNCNSLQVGGLCALVAAVTCLACRIPKGIWALPALVLLIGRQIWLLGLDPHTEAVLWYISKMLHAAYDTNIEIWWTVSNHLHRDTTAFFMAYGAIFAFVSGFTLSREKSWPSISLIVLGFVPCLLIPKMAPSPLWLALLLGTALSLRLTASVRRRGMAFATLFSLRAVVCTAVLLGFLTICFPADSYQAPELPVRQSFLDFLDSKLHPNDPTKPTVDNPGADGPGNGTYLPDKVDLSRVTSKIRSSRLAFYLTCSNDGLQYLREMSYDTYTGTSWLSHQREEIIVTTPLLLDTTQQAQIDTYRVKKNLYLPCFQPYTFLTDNKLSNPDRLTAYGYAFQPLLSNWQEIWQENYAGTSVAEQQWDTDPVFLSLPDSTYAKALAILEQLGISSSMNVLDIANAIGDYVRSSAKYSLRSGRMPSDQEDFALWFLEQAEAGYCIHFATAATVLMRAAGIPARYTVGYMVNTHADVTRNVVENNAHAWVEYYLPGFGWMILDATPSAAESEPTDPSTQPPTDPSAEDPTGPSVAPPVTDPSSPSMPTNPNATTTLPQLGTVPGGSGQGPTSGLPDWVFSALWILLQIAAAAALLLLQWRLRLLWLLRRLCRGEPNSQALTRWRHALWLSRIVKQTPPEQLFALAQKARFSQHTLTEDELEQFILHRREVIASLRSRNLFLQFAYRIILALY